MASVCQTIQSWSVAVRIGIGTIRLASKSVKKVHGGFHLSIIPWPFLISTVATTRTKLSPLNNDGDAFCCTAYETINDTLCTNIHDGSSRPAFTIPTHDYAGLQYILNPTPPQQTLFRRQLPPCPATMSTSEPVIVGVAIGIPLSAILFVTILVCIRQHRQLHDERRKATKVKTMNDAKRAYVVLPNQRVVMGRGIVRASQSIFEGADNTFEIDGRELKRDEWPLPPLPPLRKAQVMQRSPTTPTGYRKPSMGGSTFMPMEK